MTTRAATEYRYEKLTWPEINDAVALGKVCIVPCGAVEQHGPHLPLDVDLICPTEIAKGAGKQVPDKRLVLPTVAYDYTGHGMDYPDSFNEEDRPFMWVDLFATGPATVISCTSSYSETGVLGDAELATAEKGRQAYEEAVKQLARFVTWFKPRPKDQRRDRHPKPPTMPMPWGQRPVR